MGIVLKDYQEKILEELKFVPSVGLFLKTGSGKTIMSISRALNNGTKNLLIIVPHKVISQWWDTLDKFDISYCEYNIEKDTANKKKKIIDDYMLSADKKTIVVNYDIIHKLCLADYLDDTWTIILDESHKIKNMGTPKKPVITTEEVLKLGDKTPWKIILTATPTEKAYGGYIDYYSQFKFLGYIDYSYTLFRNKFCVFEKIQFPGMPFPIKMIKGYRMNLIDEEIRPILKNTCRYFAPKYGDYEPQSVKIVIPKTENYAKLIHERTYKEITFDNVSAFRIGKRTMISGKLTGTNEYGERYNYIDNTDKADWLEEFLSDTDDVVSVLYNFNVEKDMIVSACEKAKKTYIIISGDVKDKFKELQKEYDVVIGQYEAFGESLDGLQYKCHLMVFYSLPDSSRAYRQSLGRIDRIGQTEMPVYYHLVMKGTSDEDIYDMIEKKINYTTADIDLISMKEG